MQLLFSQICNAGLIFVVLISCLYYIDNDLDCGLLTAFINILLDVKRLGYYILIFNGEETSFAIGRLWLT